MLNQQVVFPKLGGLWLLLLGFFLLPTAHQSLLGKALVLPMITYDVGANTIQIGSNSGALPASEVLTLPDLANTLAAQGNPGLLVDQGSGIWLLKASILISATARLEVTSSTVTTLRLDSPPLKPVVITARHGGHLLLDGITLTSWDSTANTVDENTANERSYLLALEGGRMDIRNSDVSYLGWASGEASGLSWRKRLHPSDPTTGATGRLEDSKIHHNYFGIYSYEAYGLKILRNQVYNNLSYGIDPHDDSRAFEVAHNKVYANGNHGIIFSRLCQNNVIHNNEVYDNAAHGIMLDRGSNNNVIRDNLVYNNRDGIAIFQSSDNQIFNNTLNNNNRGIRINATFDSDDSYDGLAVNNQLTNNQITNSLEHGIYLYARADRNLITGNTILGSAVNGIYIKSGGNRLENNRIADGVIGISILGGDPVVVTPALPPLDFPGDNNLIISNTVTLNRDVGVRVLGGRDNQIGLLTTVDNGNRITNNGKDGVVIGDATSGAVATDNEIVGNLIHNNTRNGILITDVTSQRNRISRNSITGNGQLGIKLETGVQGGLTPPTITSVLADGTIGGMTRPNATVEIYSDPGNMTTTALETVSAALYDEGVQAANPAQLLAVYASSDREGATLLGSVHATDTGAWNFQVPPGQIPQEVTMVAIDPLGNSSAFGDITGSNGASAFYALTTDDNGQPVIQVTGPGAIVTLADVLTGLGTANNNAVQNLGNCLWLLNTNLFIGPEVTLNLSTQSCANEVRLRSQSSITPTNTIDYASFVYIRTHNGVINLDGVKVYSWDPGANQVDTDYDNGRAYLLAKYDAAMNLRNADVSYLGSADGESYGLAWRDTNVVSTTLRSRVTGEVINSRIHHNYYGIYTFQASEMLFRGNHFYNNVRYGFDPHDFTHDVWVEENLAYNNGAHGFIISRGCNNFIIRNNKAYNNFDPTSNLAHGFMLDPGSPNSADPQAPSFENLLENNEAYGNEGFGLRILGSNDNQIVSNNFYQNQTGITVEGGSTANKISGNILTKNILYGSMIRETADGNLVTNNQISENGSHGLYLRSSNNVVGNNVIRQNQQAGVALLAATGFALLQNNQLISNTIVNNIESGIDVRKAQQTLIQNNAIRENGGYGVYCTDSASQNALLQNVIHANLNFGIRVNGVQSYANTWSQNQIFGNQAGGILLSVGANANLAAPLLFGITDNTLSGKTYPGAAVELFSDNAQQGQFLERQTIAAADGAFSFALPATGRPGNFTAIAIDGNGNASAFSAAFPAPASPTAPATPSPAVTPLSTSPATITPPPSTTEPTVTIPPLATATPTATPTPTAATTPVVNHGTAKIHLPLIRR